MRTTVLLIISFICLSVLFKQTARPVFGVRVSIGANSQIITYACFIDNGRVLSHKRIFDQASFMKIVSGYWPSIYNPKRINYFEEHNLDCSFDIDEYKQESKFCPAFDSLWKIRFSMYPYIKHFDQGWAGRLHKPSPKQENYIYDRYNVKSIDSQFFIDSNFWRLLEDVTDPLWIKTYKALR